MARPRPLLTSWTLALSLGLAGAAACTDPVDPGALVINEAVARPALEGSDWLELYVGGTQPVDLGLYTIVDGDPAHVPAALPDIVAQPGDHIVIQATETPPADGSPSVPFVLDGADQLTLARAGEPLDVLSWRAGEAPSGVSWGRLPDGSTGAGQLEPTPGATNVALTTAPSPFVHERVVEVIIDLPEESWQAILADPEAEQYYQADLVFDGIDVPAIAVRTKGNSSLRAVQQLGSERYSLKVDIDEYISGQELIGVDKLSFNNGFKDPTLIREHIGYAVMEQMGLVVPRTSFVDLTVAGRHLGVYTLVEQVDHEFLERSFPDPDGDLYKAEPPAGRLAYLGTDFAAYGGMEIKTNETTTDHAAFLAFVDALNHGSTADVAAVLDVEGALRYLAATAILVNLDSYVGMGHNYYLYEQAGVFTVIPWDVNEAFGNFTCGCDRAGLMNLLLDEPTCSPLADLPLVGRLFADPALLEDYHQIVEEALDGPFAEAAVLAHIEETADLIRPYVEADTEKFFSTADFETGLTSDVVGPGAVTIGLAAFVAERRAALRAQLDGTSPSAGDGAGSCEGGGPPPPPCGDGVCDAFEQANPQVCPVDCVCGDGVCDAAEAAEGSCPADCG